MAKKQGIDSPVLYASSRFVENAPQANYLDLAKWRTDQLAAALENPHNPQISVQLRSILQKVQANGLAQLLGKPGLAVQNDLLSATEESGFEQTKPNLALTGNEIWNQIQNSLPGLAGITPTSIWFSELNLEISFMMAADFEQVLLALEQESEASSPLNVELRLLEIKDSHGGGIPAITVSRREIIPFAHQFVY